MTLTKDDLEFLDRIGVDDGRMKTILKNQEDAESWREFKDSLDDKKSEYPLWVQHLKIIKRLKNRIPELEKMFKEERDVEHAGEIDMARHELQKILGEKNEKD